MSKLVKAFSNDTKENKLIDSSVAQVSNDKSVVTYSMSKYFSVNQTASFNATQFIRDVKKKFAPKSVQPTYEGMSFKKEFSGQEIKYQLDFYLDSSCFLQINTTGSNEQSEAAAQAVTRFMMNEFSLLNSIVTQKEG